MTRDMDLIRKILLAVESRTDALPKEVTIQGYDEPTIARHVQMLLEAGYLKGKQQASGINHHASVTVTDLSWDGHEFISAVRNNGIWNQINQRFGAELAKLPLVIVKEAGIALVNEWAKMQIGAIKRMTSRK